MHTDDSMWQYIEKLAHLANHRTNACKLDINCWIYTLYLKQELNFTSKFYLQISKMSFNFPLYLAIVKSSAVCYSLLFCWSTNDVCSKQSYCRAAVLFISLFMVLWSLRRASMKFKKQKGKKTFMHTNTLILALSFSPVLSYMLTLFKVCAHTDKYTLHTSTGKIMHIWSEVTELWIIHRAAYTELKSCSVTVYCTVCMCVGVRGTEGETYTLHRLKSLILTHQVTQTTCPYEVDNGSEFLLK